MTDEHLLGSSPLTRGKRGRSRVRLSSLGLIPAHAGKTEARRSARILVRAHPRSRGENGDGGNRTPRTAGSSPLTRGKPCLRSVGVSTGGLIPAHAGKTRLGHQRRPRNAAHPRSRGENRVFSQERECLLGSSPLTRGRPPANERPRGRRRLIPAHAGKTEVRDDRDVTEGAHPRSRGENYIPWPITVPLMGSSPLTRGKQVPSGWIGQAGRLIPAHAGKTPGCDTMRLPRTAHPRSRGENPVM